MHRIQPQTHGYDFPSMFEEDIEVEMRGHEIRGVYFDQDNHFAGFQYVRTEDWQEFDDTPLDTARLRLDYDENSFIGDQTMLTHLVGFRTTKACASAK